MCGILLSNDHSFFNDLRYEIEMRGPDAQILIKKEPFFLLQTILRIRAPLDQTLVDKLNHLGVTVLYNGELFNDMASDTNFVNQAMLDSVADYGSTEKFASQTHKPADLEYLFSKIQIFYNSLNNYENEFAIVIFDDINKAIYFFTDDIGRRSLGFKLEKEKYFTISSIGTPHPVCPSYFYCLKINEMKIYTRPKEKQIFIREQPYLKFINNLHCTHSLNIIDNQKIQNLSDLYHVLLRSKYIEHQNIKNLFSYNKSDLVREICSGLKDKIMTILRNSVRKRAGCLKNSVSVAFSGGIDSLVTILLLDEVLDSNTHLILINTFFTRDCYDYTQSQRNYTNLVKRIDRKMVLIENMVDKSEIDQYLPQIKKLVESDKIMDINIGIVHFFTAKKANEYDKILFTGNGADEVFLGYSKYYKRYNTDDSQVCLNFEYFEAKLKDIHTDNIFRDDRIMAHNKIEMRSIFLDTALFEHIYFILNKLKPYISTTSDVAISEDSHYIRMIFHTLFINESQNKLILRDYLTTRGFTEQLKKTAMQFGTGLKKYEKSINYKN